MSLFSAMKSAVINTMAKVAFLPFTVNGSTGHWTYIDFGTAWTMDSDMVSACAMDLTCSPVAIQTTDINMALCCSRSLAAAWTTAINMASGGHPASHINMAPSSSMAHIHQHGFRQQHRPLIFAWPSVVIWATHINMATAAVGE